MRSMFSLSLFDRLSLNNSSWESSGSGSSDSLRSLTSLRGLEYLGLEEWRLLLRYLLFFEVEEEGEMSLSGIARLWQLGSMGVKTSFWGVFSVGLSLSSSDDEPRSILEKRRVRSSVMNLFLNSDGTSVTQGSLQDDGLEDEDEVKLELCKFEV